MCIEFQVLLNIGSRNTPRMNGRAHYYRTCSSVRGAFTAIHAVHPKREGFGDIDSFTSNKEDRCKRSHDNMFGTCAKL